MSDTFLPVIPDKSFFHLNTGPPGLKQLVIYHDRYNLTADTAAHNIFFSYKSTLHNLINFDFKTSIVYSANAARVVMLYLLFNCLVNLQLS